MEKTNERSERQSELIEDLASLPARNGSASCGSHNDANPTQIADALIRAFQPRKVLDVGCGSGALVKALRDRGVEAWGIDQSDEAMANADSGVRSFCRVASLSDALPDRYDLICCAGGFEFAEEDDALVVVQNLTSAADCIVLSPPSVESETSLLRLLEWFAECGFSPNIGLDVSFFASQAVSLSRKPGPKPRAADAGLLAQVESYKVRIAVLQDQLAREREYSETLRSIQGHLMQEARRLRQTAPAAEDRVAPSPIPVHVYTPEPAAAHPDISSLVQQNSDLQAQVRQLEHRSAALEVAMHHMAAGLNGIVQSRIWRTLVSISAIAVRIMPGKR